MRIDKKHVIARRPKADVAIRSPFVLTSLLEDGEEMRIATTGLRTGLAMTWKL